MPRTSPQLICFSYHKSGTSLFLHVMTKISQRLGLTLVNHYGRVDRLDPEPDIILLPHSVLRAPLDRPYRAIRLIRDPRDIWVSGYLYHQRCDEEWCRNTNLVPASPVTWPQVDYSVVHWPEAWKRRYLDRLEGKSYQQNLLDRSVQDGLDFELAGYTGCTLATMREWKLNKADALDVKLEDVMADFDAAMLRIFAHFDFNAEQRQAALEVARSEDVHRMDDAAMAERPQIHSRTISKWRDVLSATQVARFEACYGDLIHKLGYETATTASSCLENAERRYVAAKASTTHDPEIRLSADGNRIRPSGKNQDVYSFVVPPGTARVRLESRSDSPADVRPGYLNKPRRLGVKVSRITIRSEMDECVIAVDDPRLIHGWQETELFGNVFWRWTDGAGELPWPTFAGPVLVNVHCLPLTEYPGTPVDRLGDGQPE
jgi:hypothetical protein